MHQVVTFGEIMLRLAPPGHQRFAQAGSFDVAYGGGEANVAATLAGLGVPAAHMTCLPANALGEAAAQRFRGWGVDMRHALFAPNQRLGLYFLETGASLRASQVLYDRADSAFANLDLLAFDWDNILKNARWLHWTGITPAISASAAQATADAIRVARRLGLTVSADVNYRRNLWQYGQTAQQVMPALVAGCDIVVCSENDADDLFGIQPEPHAENGFASVSRQLMVRFPQIRQVLATRRETQSASHERIKGQLYDGTYLETPSYDITPVVDRIGGGDAFLGGFIYGSLHCATSQQALHFAVVASALKHTIPGDVNLVTVAEVEHVLYGHTTGRLLR